MTCNKRKDVRLKALSEWMRSRDWAVKLMPEMVLWVECSKYRKNQGCSKLEYQWLAVAPSQRRFALTRTIVCCGASMVAHFARKVSFSASPQNSTKCPRGALMEYFEGKWWWERNNSLFHNIFIHKSMLSRCSKLVYIELSYYFVPTAVLKKERSGLRDWWKAAVGAKEYGKAISDKFSLARIL